VRQISRDINYYLEILILILFFILYWVWALPETILSRNISIFLGGFLAIYLIFKDRDQITNFNALPLKFIGLLFVWSITHYLFFSSDQLSQFREITSIWKRGFFTLILGIGVGFILSNANEINRKKFTFIFLLGILGPALIYLFKTFISKIFTEIPESLTLYQSSSKFYIPKVAYLSFLLPSFVFCFCAVIPSFKSIFESSLIKILLIFSCFSILFVFLNENIRNGLICILFFLLFYFRKHFFNNILFTFLLAVAILVIFYKFYYLYFSNFYYDAYLGLKIYDLDHWMHVGDKWLPINENGIVASSSTYNRVAWLIAGLSLIPENFLGYGLIQNSFGQIAVEKWPGSNLHQTHSGWLDLALGLGVPGALLLFLSEILLICSLLNKFTNNQDPYKKVLFRSTMNALMIVCLSWFTSELSQKVYFECALLWVGFGYGLTLDRREQSSLESKKT
jgi:hypothetical protein